jgi:hypothetical protein
MSAVLTPSARGLEDDLSTAPAGTSQAPSAAVDKSALRPLPNPESIASRKCVSNGSWTIEIH